MNLKSCLLLIIALFMLKLALKALPIFRNSTIQLVLLRYQHSLAMSHPKRYFLNTLPDYQGNDNAFDENWKSKILQTVDRITERRPASVNDSEGGLYVGIGGIAYMFYHLSRSSSFTEEKQALLSRGLEYIEAALKYAQRNAQETELSSFVLGNAGTYAVAAALYGAVGNANKVKEQLKKYTDLAAHCKPINFLRCGGDELFVGRAGYLSGVLFLEKIFGKGTIPQKDIHDICHSIVESGRKYSRSARSPSPLMYTYYNVEYLGAAHGLCSILQMLLSFPSYLTSDQKADADVKASVDYLLSLQSRAGNFPCITDEVGDRTKYGDDELVHWCHGAPGVVYLMAKAYLHWREEKYLRSCIRCGELVWIKGLLRKGPGICHGVAGNGYVFLLLHRLTGDNKQLHRAKAFGTYLFNPEFKQGSRTPDSPYSLYEGLAGTVCFLADLLEPQQAAFPFLDVF